MWTTSNSDGGALRAADGSLRRKGRGVIVGGSSRDAPPVPNLPSAAGNEWTIGAWTSSAGVCDSVGGGGGRWRRVHPVAAMEESSLESLDIRAAEVLGRSMQALESSSSLTSCASAMTMARQVSKGGLVEDMGKQGRYNDDWDQSSCRRSKGGLGVVMSSEGSDHTLEIIRVLKDIVNSSDYAAKLSSVKNPERSVDSMLVEKLNFTNVKENVSQDDQFELLASGRVKSRNELSKKNALSNGQVLRSTASPLSNDLFSKDNSFGRASGFCRTATLEPPSHGMEQVDGEGGASDREERGAKNGSCPTHDRLTQTELSGLPGCEIHRQELEGCRAWGYQPGLKETIRAHRQVKLDFWHPKMLSSREGDVTAQDPTAAEHVKSGLLPKPPMGNGLSTALSVVTNSCHGESVAGVVDAKSSPVLIFAGKCVFQTKAPLDKPCTSICQSPSIDQVVMTVSTDEKGFPPPKSAHGSIEDTRKCLYSTHSTQKIVWPRSSNDRHSTRVPNSIKCQASAPSIRQWPADMSELDNWISEIIHNWLDKGDDMPHAAKTTCGNMSKTVGSAHPQSFAMELPVQSSKSLLMSGKPPSPIRNQLAELDAGIGRAQTVHDLFQMLEPVSQVPLPVLDVNEMKIDNKISSSSIIQDFWNDAVVQDFQTQIHVLEQKIKELKRSLCY